MKPQNINFMKSELIYSFAKLHKCDVYVLNSELKMIKKCIKNVGTK